MSMIRAQNKVPTVYCRESRDFQVFCRLYDMIFNNIKFDIDSMKYIINTHECRDGMLPLLQTKLGFFTCDTYDDEAMRYMLEAFPIMVKKKGSIESIKEAVNVFLKINHVRANVTIFEVMEESLISNTFVSDHTIVIGMDTAMKNIGILEEVLRYLLPAGFGFFLYFYKDLSEIDEQIHSDKAKIIFVSHDLASQVRGYNETFKNHKNYPQNKEIVDELVGAIDTAEIISSETYNKEKNQLEITSLGDKVSGGENGK